MKCRPGRNIPSSFHSPFPSNFQVPFQNFFPCESEARIYQSQHCISWRANSLCFMPLRGKITSFTTRFACRTDLYLYLLSNIPNFGAWLWLQWRTSQISARIRCRTATRARRREIFSFLSSLRARGGSEPRSRLPCKEFSTLPPKRLKTRAMKKIRATRAKVKQKERLIPCLWLLRASRGRKGIARSENGFDLEVAHETVNFHHPRFQWR